MDKFIRRKRESELWVFSQLYSSALREAVFMRLSKMFFIDCYPKVPFISSVEEESLKKKKKM